MSFLRIVTPDDIVNEQQQLAADAKGVDLAVQSCTALDPATKAAWDVWYASVQTLVAEKPVWFFPTGSNEVIMSSNLLETVQAYRRELYARQQMLSAKCSIGVPNVDPDKKPGAPDFASYLKWGAVIVSALGVAYVTAEVASTVRLFKAPPAPSKG